MQYAGCSLFGSLRFEPTVYVLLVPEFGQGASTQLSIKKEPQQATLGHKVKRVLNVLAPEQLVDGFVKVSNKLDTLAECVGEPGSAP